MLLWTIECMYIFWLLSYFFLFLDTYPGVELLAHMVVLFSAFLRNFHTVSQGLYQVTFPATVYKRCFSPYLLFVAFFDKTVLTGTRWHLVVVLICIHWWLAMVSTFSPACEPSMCLLWENVYLGLLPIFWFFLNI